jgi:hypothetical protein
MRIIGTLLTAVATAALVVTVPTVAHADTGACVSYLEDVGQDTTVRVQICAETETIGDTISTSYAFTVCVPLMSLTGLAQHHAVTACELAVAP